MVEDKKADDSVEALVAKGRIGQTIKIDRSIKEETTAILHTDPDDCGYRV